MINRNIVNSQQKMVEAVLLFLFIYLLIYLFINPFGIIIAPKTDLNKGVYMQFRGGGPKHKVKLI